MIERAGHGAGAEPAAGQVPVGNPRLAVPGVEEIEAGETGETLIRRGQAAAMRYGERCQVGIRDEVGLDSLVAFDERCERRPGRRGC